jgi:FHA domain/IPT/TIG domain
MATSWHLTSLTVLGGTLHGRKLTIEDVVVEVLIGSDPDCHLHIDLPTVSPIHARLWIEPDDVTVYGTKSGPGVFVNFDRIDGDGKIRPGDMLWLGPPQAAGSVMLQVQFEERDTLPPVTVSPLADEEPPVEIDAPARGADLTDSRPSESAPPVASAPESQAEPPAAPLAEELGVLPEDAPTPLSIALHAEEPIHSVEHRSEQSAVPGTRKLELTEEGRPLAAPEPLSPDPHGSETTAGGFEDFLVMDSPGSLPQPAPPTADEFLVSGFEAEWPDSAGSSGGSSTAEGRPHEPDGPPVPGVPPPAPPPASDDVFFVDVDASPSPSVVESPGADSFFVDDDAMGSATFAPAAPIAAPGPKPAGDSADLSFAAAFLEEPMPKAPAVAAPPPPAPRPVGTTPPPVARPKPPIAKPTAPTAPVAKPSPPAASSGAAAAPAPPAVSQRVAHKDLPVRPPSATSAMRPLPRPDVSQSVSRGDRPASPRPDRTQALRTRRPPDRPLGRYLAIGALVLAVVGGVGYAVSSLLRNVRLESIEPQRARVGETVTLVGTGFSSSPADNIVLFDDQPATVATATARRLEVVVPDVARGTDVRAGVRVRVGRAESLPIQITVFAGPVLHGISPDVAMPGDEVVLAGTGWGLGPTVRFGGLPADVLEARETSIRVRVPAIDGGPGTSAPVVVSLGAVDSNAGPFYIGRIPLLTKAEPSTVSPGDVVTLTGRGFRRERVQNVVHVGGVRALVVAAFDSEVKIVVPRVPAGSRMLDIRVPSSVAPAQVPLVIGGAGDALGFHFVAEPFDAVPGRDHAVIAAEFGPVFVLASSGGHSSAERALEAARRLNETAQSLQAARDLTFDLRDADSGPSLGLVGRPELILEVTEEDAAAYGEDWTGLRGRGGAVNAGRLGRWWEAVAKDLVLLLVRRERPHFAADLAPEGRALVDLFQAASRGAGLWPAASKVPLRDALRLVAFRVPPGVRGPTMAAPVAAPDPAPALATPAASAQPMPKLDGAWTGMEREGGRQRFVTVTFRGSTGTIAYEGVMTVSTPLLSVDQPQRGAARFRVELRGGLRYYIGRWDGQALAGKISTDAGGAQVLGTFELRPR